jgi:transposase InsO family protein
MVGYASFMKHTYSLNKFNSNEIAKFRLRVIQFSDRYGANTTKEAFNVGRSTIFLWKRKLRDGKGSLLSLIPQSTKPKRTRRMLIDPKTSAFIKNLRENNGRIGKEKIKVLLDAYCRKEGLPIVSSSKIGRVIKRNNWFFFRQGRIYHNPASGWAQRKKKSKTRISSTYKSKSPGELLQLDTLVRFDLGIKRYILTAIDLYSKFSFAFAYKSLSSRIALDFYQKLKLIAPFKISAIKTDNGLEFLGEFDLCLAKEEVKHYFSYPRTPQSNSYVERFNRTIQEEFVDSHLDYLEDTQEFNSKLVDYLLYYNTIRPHQALSYLTPMGFMIKEDLESKKYWTSTRA